MEGLSSVVEGVPVPLCEYSGTVPLRFWRLRRRLSSLFVSFRLWTTARASAPMV